MIISPKAEGTALPVLVPDSTEPASPYPFVLKEACLGLTQELVLLLPPHLAEGDWLEWKHLKAHDSRPSHHT